jgi:hypothetical protein
MLGKWQPLAGAEVKGFYSFADGSGGVAIIEADSAATLACTTAPWTTSLSFTVTPFLTRLSPCRPNTFLKRGKIGLT